MNEKIKTNLQTGLFIFKPGITMSFSCELWKTQFVVLLKTKSQRDGDLPSFKDRDGDSYDLIAPSSGKWQAR